LQVEERISSANCRPPLVSTIPEYVELFNQAFPGEKDPVTYDNVAKAIAAVERTLLTPSRFDQFLRGKSDALSPEEKQGLSLVMEKGCTPATTWGRGRYVSEIWASRPVRVQRRQGSLQRDEERGRHVLLQSPDVAKRHSNCTVLPRRLGVGALSTRRR